MTIYESDLPGVGKKFEVELDDGERLVIVTHNTGKRELFMKSGAGADSERLLELPDRLARTVGSILEGAYFQPVESSRVETMLSDETFLEWYNVTADADIVGQTLAESAIRDRFGVSVVAIQRDNEVVPSPGPDAMIEDGDTLVVIGDKEGCLEFEALLGADYQG